MATLSKKKLKHLQAEEMGGGKYGIGGKAPRIFGITPPAEFSPEVWSALADQGKLKREAGGMYSMPKPGAPR